jgi:two-component system, cell cycle response regulator DivK
MAVGSVNGEHEHSPSLARTMTSAESKPLVLLVEDYDDARDMYRDYLEFSGFRVETARDGREALDKARSLHPDVILMDLSLPGIDGWEATRILKSSPDTSGLRIIALSAHALGPEGERARQAGCDGFIAKPCLPADLVSELAVFLKMPGVPVPNGRAARPHRS